MQIKSLIGKSGTIVSATAAGLPKKFIVKLVYEWNSKQVCLAYIHDNKLEDVIVSNQFEVLEIVDPKLQEDWKAFQLLHLDSQVGFSCYVGSDPEIFVEDENGIVPAFEFLPSKDEPMFSPQNAEHNGGKPMYWDGFQAEFVTQADTCLAWQVDSVQLGLQGVLKAARAHRPKAKLSAQTVMPIPSEMLMNAAPEHVAFGCMPSLNAYGMSGLKEDGRNVPFRSAGGHIHIGYAFAAKDIVGYVKALDAILGVACVSLFASFDNPNRRKMYGLAGEYRTPPHGLEYRVLSNAWLFHPLIMNLVFDLARAVLGLQLAGLFSFWEGSESETIEVINTCNVEKARQILLRNKTVFIKLLQSRYGRTTNHSSGKVDHGEHLFNIFMSGMEYVVKDPTDIENNWNLNSKWVTHSDGKDKNFRYAIDSILKGKKVA